MAAITADDDVLPPGMETNAPAHNNVAQRNLQVGDYQCTIENPSETEPVTVVLTLQADYIDLSDPDTTLLLVAPYDADILLEWQDSASFDVERQGEQMTAEPHALTGRLEFTLSGNESIAIGALLTRRPSTGIGIVRIQPDTNDVRYDEAGCTFLIDSGPPDLG